MHSRRRLLHQKQGIPKCTLRTSSSELTSYGLTLGRDLQSISSPDDDDVITVSCNHDILFTLMRIWSYGRWCLLCIDLVALHAEGFFSVGERLAKILITSFVLWTSTKEAVQYSLYVPRRTCKRKNESISASPVRILFADIWWISPGRWLSQGE